MKLKNILLVTAALSVALPMAAIAETATSPASATSPTAAAEPNKVPDNSPVTHAQFQSLLRETLLNDPEIVMDAVKKLHEQHEQDAQKQMGEALAKHKDQLMSDTKSPSIGDPKTTDVTVVEFFDYHCGYCKHMLTTVSQIVDEDKKVRFIFREFPILSEDSVTAARAAIAVYRIEPDKYFDFHTALMKSTGKFDEKSLADIAKKVGVSPSKMKKEMENPEITKMLDENRAIAEDMGIRGTPALIVGDQVLPGAIPHDDLAKLIATTRSGVKPDAAAKPGAAPAPAKQ